MPRQRRHDLAITYAEGGLENARATLDALGFQRQGGRDPWPESRPMRVASITALGATFQIHAHVIPRLATTTAGCSVSPIRFAEPRAAPRL